MRLLLCRVCKTLEELPDYTGDANDDRTLNELVRRHNVLSLEDHQRDGVASLMHVEDRDWELHRGPILDKMKQKSDEFGGFGEPWIKDAQNTYMEDAMKCYRQHGRPQEGCTDWWSESKRIGRPTAEGRAVVESKDFRKLGQLDPHLCQWCPVASYVRTQVNLKRGAYDR
jgi:hypothetical protein